MANCEGRRIPAESAGHKWLYEGTIPLLPAGPLVPRPEMSSHISKLREDIRIPQLADCSQAYLYLDGTGLISRSRRRFC